MLLPLYTEIQPSQFVREGYVLLLMYAVDNIAQTFQIFMLMAGKQYCPPLSLQLSYYVCNVVVRLIIQRIIWLVKNYYLLILHSLYWVQRLRR